MFDVAHRQRAGDQNLEGLLILRGQLKVNHVRQDFEKWFLCVFEDNDWSVVLVELEDELIELPLENLLFLRLREALVEVQVLRIDEGYLYF